MKPKPLGLLTLDRARSLCIESLLFLVSQLLLKRGRFNLGPWLLSFQASYLVSEFLNLLLLDKDNLKQCAYQGRALRIGNRGYLRDRCHETLRTYFSPFVAFFLNLGRKNVLHRQTSGPA